MKIRGRVIEEDITRDIHAWCGDVKVEITMVGRAVSEKYASKGAVLKFVGVLWLKIRPTDASKCF